MLENKGSNTYSQTEERLNVISHAIGLALSVVALILLILRAGEFRDAWLLGSFVVFGLTMILLYAASTFYHNSRKEKLRYRLQILDHAAIYFLIAGTYTPFALVTLRGTIGWIIFGVVWSLAIVGAILKLFFTGRYDVLSTVMYVLMGWIILFAIKPLIENLSMEGLLWMFAGGISYMVGAVLYSINRIKYNHAIFHVFVLLGTFCHFMAVYFHVLPKG